MTLFEVYEHAIIADKFCEQDRRRPKQRFAEANRRVSADNASEHLHRLRGAWIWLIDERSQDVPDAVARSDLEDVLKKPRSHSASRTDPPAARS